MEASKKVVMSQVLSHLKALTSQCCHQTLWYLSHWLYNWKIWICPTLSTCSRPCVPIPMLPTPCSCPHNPNQKLPFPHLIPTLPSSCLECCCISVVVWLCFWDGNMEMGVGELALLSMILSPMLLSKCSHCCAPIMTFFPHSYLHMLHLSCNKQCHQKILQNSICHIHYKFLVNMKGEQ